LKDLPFRLVSLRDLPGAPSVVEDGETFVDNARRKARELALWSGRLTLADDSGLVVDSLGGRPGVHSARYAGEKATDEDNRQKLLREMAGVPQEQRGAAFVCVLVLAHPDGREVMTEGRVDGRIALSPRGSGGFGYDPLFLIPALGKTTAELPLDEKNRISHRGLALDAMREKMNGHSFSVHIAL
jgi:XTP/dITP diphosphohydrolase